MRVRTEAKWLGTISFSDSSSEVMPGLSSVLGLETAGAKTEAT